MDCNVQSYTEKGENHRKNEDYYLICDDYVIIADGMGGEQCGDIAARIAVESIDSVLSQKISIVSNEVELEDLSKKAICFADRKISEYIVTNPDSFGMGTTVLLAIIKDDILFVSWCGDSHCYSYKDGKIISLTKDHSYVQELIDSGNLSEDESFTHPDNNIVTRFIGGGEDTCNPDFCSHKISESELFILCTDGLSGYCRKDEISIAIRNNQNISELPEQLSELAVFHGSDDDKTIVLIIPKTHVRNKGHGLLFGWIKKQ